MISMTDDPSFSYYVYTYYRDICVDDAQNANLVRPYLSIILDHANQIIDSYQLDQPKDSILSFDYSPHFNALNSLFGYFKDSKEVDAYFQRIMNISDPNLLVNIVDAMLMRNDEVPLSIYDKITSNPYYWKLLLDAVAYENNLDKIPAELFTQERTVESILANNVENYYGHKMIDFKIVDTREHTLSDKKLKMYSFTFNLLDVPDESYFGMCSQPIDSKPQVTNNYFDYFPRVYEPKKKEEMIAEFLKIWEE